jgi:heat shock protein HslJ
MPYPIRFRRVARLAALPAATLAFLSVGGNDASGASSAAGAAPTALNIESSTWVVEDLNRAGIIDRSRATLEFETDGRLSGRASCNTYVARYALSGEGIGVTDIVTTDRTCAPALMLQEQRFLEALVRIERFEMTRDGALVLHGAGHRILGRRP